MSRKKLIVPAVLVGVAVGAWLGARHLARTHASTNATKTSETATTEPKPIELHVPHAKGPVPLRAELDEGPWLQETARTNAFVGVDGAPARPYSDARLVWADGNLYVGLYAADEEIVSTKKDADAPLWIEDAFHVSFTVGDVDGVRSTIDVSPLGVITDGRQIGAAPVDFGWQSGAKVDVEHDGTPNDPSDDDEEWLVAMQVPLASLGVDGKPGTRIGFSAHRCDTPKKGARTCGAFGESPPGVVLVLDD
jgi:hypothetical protein